MMDREAVAMFVLFVRCNPDVGESDPIFPFMLKKYNEAVATDADRDA